MVIKPSGVEQDGMGPEDMAADRKGSAAEGRRRPSGDTAAHAEPPGAEEGRGP